MIQRIQSLLLLLASILNLAGIFIPFWTYSGTGGLRQTISTLSVQTTQQAEHYFYGNPLHILVFVLTLLAAIVLIASIFQYANRLKQIRWVFAGIIILLLQILAMILQSRMGPFGLSEPLTTQGPGPALGMSALAILLAWWANRRIRADEALVKSIDRIR